MVSGLLNARRGVSFQVDYLSRATRSAPYFVQPNYYTLATTDNDGYFLLLSSSPLICQIARFITSPLTDIHSGLAAGTATASPAYPHDPFFLPTLSPCLPYVARELVLPDQALLTDE